jgi:NAD(P)-dependent dehydrogenase (short-subunit alcohol dehydrogenase family)
LLGAYAAAKHGVVGLTKTAAYEFGRQGVRVNAICPFFSPTPLVTQEGGLADRMDTLKKSSPMNRMGDPEEMVEVMLMLMSPTNSFMNGQAVAVDGGMSAI